MKFLVANCLLTLHDSDHWQDPLWTFASVHKTHIPSILNSEHVVKACFFFVVRQLDDIRYSENMRARIYFLQWLL